MALALGILFSPRSWGPLYFIAILLTVEILRFYYTRHVGWNPYQRGIVIVASMLGWWIGRWMSGIKNPLRNACYCFTTGNLIEKK